MEQTEVHQQFCGGIGLEGQGGLVGSDRLFKASPRGLCQGQGDHGLGFVGTLASRLGCVGDDLIETATDSEQIGEVAVGLGD